MRNVSRAFVQEWQQLDVETGLQAGAVTSDRVRFGPRETFGHWVETNCGLAGSGRAV